MYAVVEIAGNQYKITEDSRIVTEKMPGNPGDKVEFDRVLMYVDGDTVKVGQPLIDGAKVSATIEAFTRRPKVVVFKKKRRKGYRRTRGHRQQQTALRIEKIAVA
ncbi:MAG TPA: 50S ribosomal protein L21 [Bacteroidetes bacterium]|nr:50S ribosomal protein L21 [Bacteroidota bacterium]